MKFHALISVTAAKVECITALINPMSLDHSSQFKYMFFHILIFALTTYVYIANSQFRSWPHSSVGKHCSGIAQVMGSNPVQT